MKEDKVCYKCGKIATSKEHVPPICLFPEQKDVGGADFRKNLITVPSCEEHNTQKSNDDEFLLATIAGVVGNNVLGYVQTKTKVKRIHNRKGKRYIEEIAKNHKELTIKSKEGIEFSVMTGLFDNKRLIKCFQHIACGLYFHEFQKIFDGECPVFIAFTINDSEKDENLKVWFKKEFELNSEKWLIKGANPSVFKYQFGEPDYNGLIPLRMTFYKGADVYVSFMDKTIKKPFDLTHALIEGGVSTTIVLQNGEKIQFNSNK